MRNRRVSRLLAVVRLGWATLSSNLAFAAGITLLHSFAGAIQDGSEPTTDLTLSGTTLFSTTNTGGANRLGTLFSIKTDGTGFKLLHSFAGSNQDGSFPSGGLTLSGTTL